MGGSTQLRLMLLLLVGALALWLARPAQAAQTMVSRHQSPILDCEVSTYCQEASLVLCTRQDNSVGVYQLDQDLHVTRSIGLANEPLNMRPFKSSYFFGPKNHTLYYVVAYSRNATTMGDNEGAPAAAVWPSKSPSSIKIYKVHRTTQGFTSRTTQTLRFASPLVDFDITFGPKHCYMSVVLQRHMDNLELYEWTRTQFDRQAVRTTYAHPESVKMFQIRDHFYIAVAQQQLFTPQMVPSPGTPYVRMEMTRTQPTRTEEEYADALFVGNPVFRFKRDYEHDLIYHQYIKLAGQARKVEFFREQAEPWRYATGPQRSLPEHEQNFLVFGTNHGVDIYRWAPLNQLFWPHQLYWETAISGVTDLSVASIPNTTDTLITVLSGASTKLNFLTARMPAAHSSTTPNYPMEIRSKQFNLTSSLDLNVNGRITSVRLINHKTRNRLYVQTLMDVNGASRHQTMMHHLDIDDPDGLASQQRDQRQYNPAEASNSLQGRNVDMPENCFRELERLLLLREFELAQLNARRDNIWRRDGSDSGDYVVNITAPVIVHGSVIVRGSLLKSPQMIDIRNKSPQAFGPQPRQQQQISPSLFDLNLNLARARLDSILRKLTHAVHPQSDGVISGKTRFLKGLTAREVVFSSGIRNDDVSLNGIPFKQLEREAVTLRGHQHIRAQTIFQGSVVADRLEIHGRINGRHYLKDAIDITSKEWQIIDSPLNLRSVEADAAFLLPDATLNGIKLNEFVTSDRLSQMISGTKTFRSLTMRNLKIHDAILNGKNVSRLAHNAIPLEASRRPTPNAIITGNINFLQNVRVKELVINNLINRHINLTSLITDSVRSVGLQTMTGHKRFLNGLHVGRLQSFGKINDVTINDMFTLRQAHYNSGGGGPVLAPSPTPSTNITGRFQFMGPVTIKSNLHAARLNGIDLNREAVLRRRHVVDLQVINGVKTFRRPVRILDKIAVANDNRTTINGFDFHRAIDELDRKMRIPPPIYIDRLLINGNLFVASNFINNQTCPLQAIKDRLVSRSSDDQTIKVPVRIRKLSAKSILVAPGGLNQMSFPGDFVLKSIPPSATTSPIINPAMKHQMMDNVQFVYGRKTFNHLRVSNGPAIVGPGATINNVSYYNIHTYIDGETRVNATRQKFLQTMTVHGNIYANRINGRRWPDDVLLRFGQNQRIYSQLVFEPSTKLQVRGHLTLRGPVNLRGRLNNFNLTEFVQNSVTYGDKDLLVVHRPIRNKVFVGGIKTNELICDGMIDGVDFDEMRSRVVYIDGDEQQIVAPKRFASQVNFTRPITVAMMNGLNFQDHVNSIVQAGSYGTNGLVVRGHKTIMGNIKINRDLLVDGRINGLNLSDIQAKSISLSSQVNNTFNRTFIVEGDAYMDQMFIDEKHGVIDGIPLSHLIPIASAGPQAQTTHIKSPVVLHTDIYVSKDVLLNGLPQKCNLTSALNNAIGWSRHIASSGAATPYVDPRLYHVINNLALNSNVSAFHLPGRRHRRQNGGVNSVGVVDSVEEEEEMEEHEIDGPIDLESEQPSTALYDIAGEEAIEDDDYDQYEDQEYNMISGGGAGETNNSISLADDPTLAKYTKNAVPLSHIVDLPVDLTLEENLERPEYTQARVGEAHSIGTEYGQSDSNAASRTDTDNQIDYQVDDYETTIVYQDEPPLDGPPNELDTHLATDKDGNNGTAALPERRTLNMPAVGVGPLPVRRDDILTVQGRHHVLYSLQQHYDRLHDFIERIRYYGSDHLVNGKEPLMFLQSINNFIVHLKANRKLIETQVIKIRMVSVRILGFQDQLYHTAQDESDLYFARTFRPVSRAAIMAANEAWRNLTQHQQGTLILDTTEFPPYVADSKNYTLIASTRRAYDANQGDLYDTVTSYTRVFAWHNQAQVHTLVELSVLPTENPATAKFVQLGKSLFLIIGQDPPQVSCPVMMSPIMAMSTPQHPNMMSRRADTNGRPIESTARLQIYLLQTLVSSNRFNDSSFDLFQSLDLPPISYLEPFEYHNRSYLLAVSARMQLVYLLKLRGYHGFQIIQQFSAPSVEFVRVLNGQMSPQPTLPPASAIKYDHHQAPPPSPLRLAVISRQPGYSKIMTAALA